MANLHHRILFQHRTLPVCFMIVGFLAVVVTSNIRSEDSTPPAPPLPVSTTTPELDGVEPQHPQSVSSKLISDKTNADNSNSKSSTTNSETETKDVSDSKESESEVMSEEDEETDDEDDDEDEDDGPPKTEEEKKKEAELAPPVGTNLCGVYSVYGALRTLGHKIELSSLVGKKYVGSQEGSSIKELRLAVQDHGGVATPLFGLCTFDLQWFETPVILNVTASEEETGFRHWVLFLGLDPAGKAKLLDSKLKVESVELADLAARWNGVGVVVSNSPIDPIARLLPRVTQLSLVFLGAFAFVTFVKRYLGPSRSLLTQIGIISVSSLAVALLYHSVTSLGFLVPGAPVKRATVAFFPPKFQEIDFGQLEKLRGDHFLVDARFAQDFGFGSIPGARNVPFHVGGPTRDELMKGIKKSDKVIIFCQSESCMFDDTLALKLHSDGYSQIVLYRGGFMEWESLAAPAQRKLKEKQESVEPLKNKEETSSETKTSGKNINLDGSSGTKSDPNLPGASDLRKQPQNANVKVNDELTNGDKVKESNDSRANNKSK